MATIIRLVTMTSIGTISERVLKDTGHEDIAEVVNIATTIIIVGTAIELLVELITLI